MKTVSVFILRAPGTNCDIETGVAFQKAGAQTAAFHINEWIANPGLIHQYQILALPGGFSYGDDLGSGTVLGNEITQRLIGEISRFIKDGKLAIGICNGFQVLVKTGFLPGLSGDTQKPMREAALFTNDSARYEDRWVYLRRFSQKCVFTKDMPEETIYLPVAHGEGKFMAKDKETLDKIIADDQVVFRYCDEAGRPTHRYPLNPNGAMDNIAAICDTTGRILGMMPHPERFMDITNHPRWTRKKPEFPHGMLIFNNAVKYVKDNL
ncbi:MAG: phosphoribosylformylglycinamidine synthase I [Planctomycetota bacterium]